MGLFYKTGMRNAVPEAVKYSTARRRGDGFKCQCCGYGKITQYSE